jgi:Rieske 2Fe-2S family protein
MLAGSPRPLLPADAYWSEPWFEREQRQLFGRTWHLVASTEQLGETGNAVCIDAGYDPLVVVRGDDDRLRAFHNICPHRGAKLVDDCAKRAVGISCPYHSWGFSLSGALTRVPQREQQFAGLDTSEWGLRHAAVAVWEGMVFAHTDPAADFHQWLGGLPDRIGSFRPGQLTEVARHSFDAACNWKLFVENHVDVYHLWYLHARTLGDYDHWRFEWEQLGANWVSYEPIRAGITRTRPHAGATQISHIDDRDREGIGAHAAFPNVLMASEAEFFITYVARPVAPNRTTIDLRVRAEPGSDADALVAGAGQFIREDIAACERVQATVRSSQFAVGPMAREHERPIELFHRHVLAALERV